MIIGDFNRRNSNWYHGDPVTPQGTHVEALRSFYGLNQLIIKTLAWLLQNSSTFIDLGFTNQPYLVMKSGVHSSLSSMCHHEIFFVKLNMSVKYLPPFEHVLWDYSRADTTSLNQAINPADWGELFANKTVESQVSKLNNLL